MEQSQETYVLWNLDSQKVVKRYCVEAKNKTTLPIASLFNCYAPFWPPEGDAWPSTLLGHCLLVFPSEPSQVSQAPWSYSVVLWQVPTAAAIFGPSHSSGFHLNADDILRDLILQDWPLHTLQQLIDGVDIVVDQFQGLYLGPGGSWIVWHTRKEMPMWINFFKWGAIAAKFKS